MTKALGIPKILFELQSNKEDPRLEGFGTDELQPFRGCKTFLEFLSSRHREADLHPRWKPPRMTDKWTPPKVCGRVAEFNDFPGLSLGIPVFSERACQALADFLEPNGELLPLDSELETKFYMYNVTTLSDALDHSRSECKFYRRDPPTTAVSIDYFAFNEEKLRGLSIFLLYELPSLVIVTEDFVNRVREEELEGFQFSKIWPFEQGVNWRMVKAERRRERQKKLGLKQHSLVIVFPLDGAKPDSEEDRKLNEYGQRLNATLAVQSMDDPYFGSYELSDIEEQRFRMFMSCPDVDRLVLKLAKWLNQIDWPVNFYVCKRYGDLYDPDVPEALATISPEWKHSLGDLGDLWAE